MGCHCHPYWSIMIVLMEDGDMNQHQAFQLNQLGFEEDLLGYKDHDETNLLLEETWPQIINQRTMRVIRYAIRDSVDRAIKEVLMRP